MKTRAAVLTRLGAPAPYAQSKPLEIWEVDLEPPGPDEVLVRVAAAGLCHSDLSVINGDRPFDPPIVLGHEASGVVEALGEGVTDLAVGDPVVMLFAPGCGQCATCAEGRPALCLTAARTGAAGTLLSGARRLSRAGQPISHFAGVAAFAEHAVLSRRGVLKIEPGVPLELAALFGCAVMTGVGAVTNTARVSPGQSVAVVGLGGVGLSAVMGAVAAGAACVVAVDLNPQKLAQARRAGATHTVNAGDADALKQVRSITSGGADHAFEMVGSTRALEAAYRMTRRGGQTVTVGLPAASQKLGLEAWHLVAEERTLKGSYMGSCIPQRDVARYLALHRAGRLPVEQLVTGHIALEQINEGFDRLANGEAVRQIIRFGG